MIESLVAEQTGLEVWVVLKIHLLVHLATESLVVVDAGKDVWVVEEDV